MSEDRRGGSAAEVDGLLSRGFAALEDGDLKAAFKIARKLEEMGHSACFELAALAHEEAGEIEEALEVLERGLSKAPGVWILWQLRGNLLSDLDRCKDAQEAYKEGLAIEGCDKASLSYNLALSHYRNGDLAAARQALEGVTGEDTALPRLALEVGIDLAEGKHDAAEEKARDALAKTLEAEADPVAFAALHVHLGEVLLARGAKDDARAMGMRAVEIDPVNHGVYALLREIDEPALADASSFEIVLEGELRDAPEVGFHKSYQVKAEDADRALEKLLVFETLANSDTLRVEKSEELEFDLGPRTGVYSSSGYVFFDRE